MPDKPNVKKVSAFPFPITITLGALVLTGQVVKMTGLGLMAEVTSGLVAAGDKVEMSFVFPVVKEPIACSGVVVKLLQQVNRPRLVEIHFKNIPDQTREKIANYLAAAGVKP